MTAMFDVVSELDLPSATVAEVVRRAGVSRSTFYEQFEDRSECFLAVLESAVGQLALQLRAAYEAEDSWVEGIRAALSLLLSALERDPVLARLCLLESTCGGECLLARRGEFLRGLAALLDVGREAGEDPPAPLTAELLVGGVISVIQARLAEPRPEPLSDLLNPLMSMIALPYLGRAAARQELTKSPGSTATATRPPIHHGTPLWPDCRLTYRTLRVLTAIASHPGASNRRIAELSGISDWGQVSRLLTRLAAHSLIRNDGAGQRGGGANAWSLTERGERVQRETSKFSTEAA
jgi:AcrR family transcriptional regulator